VNQLSAACGRLFDALATLAALILLTMVGLVSADIVLRNIAHGGFLWANEISEYALYLITLLATPWLLRRGRHIRLDLILVMLPIRVVWLVEAASDVIGLAISLVLIRYGVAMTYDSWRIGSITIKNLVFPEWWLLAPLPVVFFLIAIEFIFRLHRLLGERSRRSDATSVS
jgi:TRAP-type C4-dicarboxylate transport system permease small subunit